MYTNNKTGSVHINQNINSSTPLKDSITRTKRVTLTFVAFKDTKTLVLLNSKYALLLMWEDSTHAAF